MREVETHTEDFLSLCPVAKQLADQYKPSDVLDKMMVEIATRWDQYVKALTERYCVFELSYCIIICGRTSWSPGSTVLIYAAVLY